MNKVIVLNNSNKYISILKSKFKEFEIKIITEEELKKYQEKVSFNEDNALYKDYLRLYIAYIEGGFVLDGKIEIKENLKSFFESEIFLGYNTENSIATNIVWSKDKKNPILKKALEEIQKDVSQNITEVFSKVVNKDLSKRYNTLVNIDNKMFFYPYDYFYPLDYEKHGKNISENTKIIFHENLPLSKSAKMKYRLYKRIGPYALKYLLTLIDIIRNKMGAKRYINKQLKGKFEDKNEIEKSVLEAARILDEYKNINPKYVVFHNPKWLGVTSATKELFENLVPCMGTYTNKQVNLIFKKINELNLEQVIFSGFEFGFDKLIRKIKENNKNIKIKVFWHGSNSQINGGFVEFIHWKTTLKIINLNREGIIDILGTCKESLVNFYKSQNIKTVFVKNTVKLKEDLKAEILKLNFEEKNMKIGLYASGMGWIKNMFNQVAAASFISKATLDSIPLNFDGQVFASKIGLEMDGINKGVKREELLKRMHKNNINLYVTFSECAPMLPIESMEVGTICITGNNHHYFKGTELENYLVVSREDDVVAIVDKIKYALENKEEIFRLYKKWKENYDIESQKSVQEFLR